MLLALALGHPAAVDATVVSAEITPPAPGGDSYASGSETAMLDSTFARAATDLPAGTLRAYASTSADDGVTYAVARSGVDSLILTSTDPLLPFEIAPGAFGLSFDATFSRLRTENLDGGNHYFTVLLEVGLREASGAVSSARGQLVYSIDMKTGAVSPLEIETGGAAVDLTTATGDAVAGTIYLPGFTIGPGDRLSLQAAMFTSVSVSPVYDPLTGEVTLPTSEWPEGITDGYSTASLFLNLPAGAGLAADGGAPLAWITPVPEPSSAVLAVCGLAVLARLRARRARRRAGSQPSHR